MAKKTTQEVKEAAEAKETTAKKAKAVPEKKSETGVSKPASKPAAKAEEKKTIAKAEPKAEAKKAPAKAAAKVEEKKVAEKAEPKAEAKKAPAKAAPKAEEKKAPAKAEPKVEEKAETKKAAPKVVAKVEEKEEAAPAKNEGFEAPKVDLTNVRYSDAELEEFRHTIEESRLEALDELGMLKERLDDLTNYDFAEESMIYSMHMAEQGSEAMEKEKTYAQIQRIQDYIKKLDDALQRIKDKTYGICRVCGILIAKERLLAVPVTTLSASYKIHQKCPEDGKDKIEPVKGVLE